MATAPTQADFEKVRDLAHKLAMSAQETFAEHPLSPLLALAALSTAACQVAVVTDTSFHELMELITVHFHSAAVGVTMKELEDQRKKDSRS